MFMISAAVPTVGHAMLAPVIDGLGCVRMGTINRYIDLVKG